MTRSEKKKLKLDRPVLYDVHCIVRGPFDGNGIVDKNIRAASKGEQEICFVKTRTGTWPYHEKQLRKATVREVMFFQHPTTKALRIGNNPALTLFLGEPIALAGTWAFASLGGDTALDQVLGWFFPILAMAIPALLFGGAWLQYRGKWK